MSSESLQFANRQLELRNSKNLLKTRFYFLLF